MVRKNPDVIVALVIFVLSLILYVATLAPSVMPGDSAELQYAAYLLYLVHPTGYPLYLLMGWVWSHLLPVGDVAYRMNLFSALWAAVTVALVYLVAVHSLPGLSAAPRRLAAILGAASLAVSETFWDRAVVADVRAFTALSNALLLYLLLRWAEAEEAGGPAADRWLLGTAFAFGLSLTHHRTMLFLLPGAFIFVLGTLSKTRRRDSGWGRFLLDRYWLSLGWKLFLLVALPQLLYLYIPLRGPHDPTRRLELAPGKTLVLYESSLEGFRSLLFGSGLMSWVLPLEGLRRISSLWELLLRQFGYPGVALGVIGVLYLVLSRRWRLLALTGLTYVANGWFALSYFVNHRFFYIPTYVIFALWIALGGAGCGWLARRVRERMAQAGAGESAGVIVVALLLLLPINTLRLNYPLLDQSGNRDLPELWGRVLAEPIPAGAILAGNDRNEMQAMWYYQFVEGRRPDLLNMFPHIGGEIVNNDNTGSMLADLLRVSDRPIFLVKPMPGVEIKVRLEPYGSLYRVLGPAVQGPPQRERQATLGGAVELIGYDQEPRSIEPGKGAIVTLYWRVLRPLDAVHSSYVHLVDGEGRGVAQGDHVPGGDYYPTTLWQPGEILVDRHVVAVPGDVPAGVYRLVVGMYRNEDAAPLGAGVAIGRVAVKEQVQTAPGPMAHKLEADWGGVIKLLGYDLERAGERMLLTLHWRAEQLVDEDYTVFVHLLNESGEILAQGDSQPRGGAYPTSVWDLGEVVADQHEILLEAGMAEEGQYRLEVGLYLLETGERLPVFDEQGRRVGDALVLAERDRE